MNTYADKTSESKKETTAVETSQKLSRGKSALPFVDNRPGMVAQKKLQETIAKSAPVSQLVSTETHENSTPVIQLVSTKDRLKNFKSNTDGGWFESRSSKLKAIDTRIGDLAKTIVGDEPANQTKVKEILHLVIEAEDLLESETRQGSASDKAASEKRLAGFQTWKTELVDNLDKASIKQTVTSFTNSREVATKEHQQTPLHIGVNEEKTGMGGLKASKYAAINSGLRKDNEDNIALYEGYRALKHYDKKQGNPFMKDTGKYHSVGKAQPRYGNTLLGGVLPADVVPHQEYLEKGFAFFGPNADKTYGKYLMHVTLTKVMTIESNMYGAAEKDEEYISAPGAKFRYDNSHGGIYYFTQTA